MTPFPLCPTQGLGSRGAPWGQPQTHLDEVPALVEAALDLVTVQQLREAALARVHQAARVGQQGGGAQGPQVQEALPGVPSQLGTGDSRTRQHLTVTE